MTLKEKLETIRGKKIAIWCEEEWMADSLTREYESDDFTYTHWTCYDLESENLYLTHADVDWYLENGFDLVTYKKFIEDIDKVIITNQDITDLLNEKYGKDKWVIK